MKILFVASYYYPYTSGLTIYCQKLAEGLAKHKHEIIFLTNQHLKELKKKETINGVRVFRLHPLIRLSRGFITPRILLKFWQQLSQVEIVGLHLPLPEAFLFAPLAKLRSKKVFLIYHANLNLPSWSISTPLFENIVLVNHLIAGFFAHKIVASSQDYAKFARFLRLFSQKIEFIYPPVEIRKPNIEKVKILRKKWAPLGEKLIGFAGRFAQEKGGDILIASLPEILKKFPKTKIVFAGEYRNLIYENFYQKKKDLINRFQKHLLFLGPLGHEKMPEFYAALDILALPSRAEGFPLAPVEAMLSGCPVVSFDIPGARMPIKLTGMGKIAGAIDSQNFVKAIIDVLSHRKKFIKPRREIEKKFDYQQTLNNYIKLFSRQNIT